MTPRSRRLQKHLLFRLFFFCGPATGRLPRLLALFAAAALSLSSRVFYLFAAMTTPRARSAHQRLIFFAAFSICRGADYQSSSVRKLSELSSFGPLTAGLEQLLLASFEGARLSQYELVLEVLKLQRSLLLLSQD